MEISKYFELDKREEMTEELLDEIKDILEKASSAYYNTSRMLLSDREFDELKDLYESYREELPVGAAPISGKGTVSVSHTFEDLVGGLKKVNTMDELLEWVSATFPDPAKRKNLVFAVTEKYDGNSISIEYKNGKVVVALTRGRNGKGVDLTKAFRKHTVDIENHCAIKYEVIITFDNFQKIIEEKGTKYANPRSLVAGILGSDNAHEYYDYLDLVPLGIKFSDPEFADLSKEEEFEILSDLVKENDKMPSYLIDNLHTFSMENIHDIGEVYDKYTLEYRDQLPYMLDGLVIEVTDPQVRKRLGITNSKPNYAVALKFPYKERETTVTGFEFDFGETGRITPAVLFEPVEFNGAVQRRVSLSNKVRFEELGLGIGSKVVIQYRNDVLSYLTKMDTPENDLIEPFPFTDKCPVCGGGVVENESGALVYCASDFCEGKVPGRIERYLRKLDIKGIRNATIMKLYENSLVTNIADIYRLDYDRVASINGLGSRSAEIIKEALDSRKSIYDYELLGGIGISDFGLTNARALMKEFTMDELFDFDEEKEDFYYNSSEFWNRINSMGGFSETRSRQIIDGLNKFHDEIADIAESLDIVDYREEFSKNKDEKTYTFVVTGSINTWKNRNELKKELESRGHKVSGSVTSNTDYLVNNDVNSTSSKNKAALALDKPIIDEEQLRELLGLA
jgi:DNA ligase (NAD+)